MTIREWLSVAERRLADTGVSAPRIEAQVLACHVLLVDRAWLFAHPEEEINDLAAEYLLQRREAGEPLGYITGWREFFGRKFGVDPAVLIPRHETETLIEVALELGSFSATVLDFGTGSGNIAITLKLERPLWEVTAIDVSASALTTASANAKLLGASVRFILSDGFRSLLGESFDLVVSNPPYVAPDDELPTDVVDHEPGLALFAAEEGMEFYTRLAHETSDYLTDGGVLLMECGVGQADRIRQIFEEQGWRHVLTRPDLAGIERVLAFSFPQQFIEAL